VARVSSTLMNPLSSILSPVLDKSSVSEFGTRPEANNILSDSISSILLNLELFACTTNLSPFWVTSWGEHSKCTLYFLEKISVNFFDISSSSFGTNDFLFWIMFITVPRDPK